MDCSSSSLTLTRLASSSWLISFPWLAAPSSNKLPCLAIGKAS
ncbi:Uncharacterised protein [Vibrio cholerae]|nr:Uncharacterised protein [Vibrio cholerae]